MKQVSYKRTYAVLFDLYGGPRVTTLIKQNGDFQELGEAGWVQFVSESGLRMDGGKDCIMVLMCSISASYTFKDENFCCAPPDSHLGPITGLYDLLLKTYWYILIFRVQIYIFKFFSLPNRGILVRFTRTCNKGKIPCVSPQNKPTVSKDPLCLQFEKP